MKYKVMLAMCLMVTVASAMPETTWYTQPKNKYFNLVFPEIAVFGNYSGQVKPSFESGVKAGISLEGHFCDCTMWSIGWYEQLKIYEKLEWSSPIKVFVGFSAKNGNGLISGLKIGPEFNYLNNHNMGLGFKIQFGIGLYGLGTNLFEDKK